MRFIILYTLCILGIHCQAQTYTNWLSGNGGDTTTQHEQGVVLAGGGGDNDAAMTWFLERANGGDVVVLRASGSDGYNPYFYTDLGVTVHSVETFLINSVVAAQDSYVVQQVRNAEALFIAGGDQYDYYSYWNNTALGDALNYLLNDKKIVVGGTSAGMAILGQAYYAPSASGVIATEALGNPFHPNMDILGYQDFLLSPFLENTITDTHFDQRDRAGRTVGFLAKLYADFGLEGKAIACNEYTTVCIDSLGVARVFGDSPNYPDYAYFVQWNCPAPLGAPEVLQSGTPLSWNRDSTALKVYKVGGLGDGSPFFDLNDWQTGNGGTWETWSVEQGSLSQIPQATAPSCLVSSVEDIGMVTKFQVFPNPSIRHFYIESSILIENVELFTLTGVSCKLSTSLNATHHTTECFIADAVPKGLYVLKIRTKTGTYSQLLTIQ